MAQSNWEADKMLDVYIYDYLVKKKLHTTAKSFMTEGKVAPDPVAIDAPGGFLFEWWSVFWDIFIARTNDKHSEAASAYIETQQIKAREQQQQQMQQLQLMRQAPLQRRDSNNPPLGSPLNSVNPGGMLGQATASAIAAKMYEDRMKQPNSMDSETSQPLLDARMALMKSTTNEPGQLVQGNSGSVNAASQQIQARSVTLDIKGEVMGSGSLQRSSPMDTASVYGSEIMLSKPGMDNSGLSPGASTLPLKGWPLTAIDEIQPGLGAQAQKPFLHSANQLQVFPHQQRQQLLAQAQAQGGLGSSPIYSLPRSSLNSKDGKPIANDGSIGSSMQSTSTKIDIPHMQQSSSQQQDALHTQQVQQDNMDHFGDIGSLEDNVESFLSSDDLDGRDLFGPLTQNPSAPAAENSKGFSFVEVGSIRKSNSKVVCCHFSSDGKLLASAGHDKKVVLWNMETMQTEITSEDHNLVITDVRFRPNSTQLATSSYDTTVRLWDAAQPNYCLQAYAGHTSHVLSLDFHPKKNDLFCSCDANNEIRFWNISQFSPTRVFKGGSEQVRFQPRIGHFLAAATENVVSIFDVETDRQTHVFKGHSTEVNSLCWDANGDCLASVSQDSVRVWSLSSGECIHELSSSGNMFHSCVFHPSYSTLLVIGGYQSLELWNTAEKKRMTIPAHEHVISALAQTPVTGMVASASHDKSVKIWK